MKNIRLYVSVTGAFSHPDSIFYIPRIKGECERAIIEDNVGKECAQQNKGRYYIDLYRLPFSNIQNVVYHKFSQIYQPSGK